MKNVFLVVIAIFALFVNESFGQSAKREWTLKECVDIALENNLRIKRSVYNVETFRANLMQAEGSFLPTLNANGSYINNYGRALNPTTNLYVDKNSTAISPSINSSLTLFNGLRIQNTFRQNQRDVASAQYDLQKAKNDVILNDNSNYQLKSS